MQEILIKREMGNLLNKSLKSVTTLRVEKLNGNHSELSEYYSDISLD